MIPVETLIKDLGYEKKLNGCFASTFTEADSQSSQRSKIKLFEKIFKCFRPLTIAVETFILDV